MAGGVDRATFDIQGIVWGLQILSAKESCGGPARQRSTPESIVKSAGRPILRFSRDLGFSGHRKKSWAASIDRGKKPRALQFWHRSFAGGQFISARPCLSFSTEQDERATDFWRLRRFSKLPFAGGEPEGLNSRRFHRCPPQSALPVPPPPAGDTVAGSASGKKNAGEKRPRSLDLLVGVPARPTDLSVASTQAATGSEMIKAGLQSTYIWEK